MEKIDGYWFFIEPYVYPHVFNDQVMLYNTLDGSIIKKENPKLRMLLEEILKRKNGGVSFLSSEQYARIEIREFIDQVREKFMGDIIDVSLSQRKPVQILPYVDFTGRQDFKDGFLRVDNMLHLLEEVTIHINQETDLMGLSRFVRSLPEGLSINLRIDREMDADLEKLFAYLERIESNKTILSDYDRLFVLSPDFKNKFSYKIDVHFPIDETVWKETQALLKAQDNSYEFVFYVENEEHVRLVESLILRYDIEKYVLSPVYTKNNIEFFTENVFLTSEDILSIPICMKELFKRQVLNNNDFGRFTIQPNGDVYANRHHPALGNISVHSIYYLIQKEIKEGRSWLRIRNQSPCNQCAYQWLCPSPSDYEIEIGRSNLCHVIF